ncbi:unnamed protein product [Urochloa humidicola]
MATSKKDGVPSRAPRSSSSSFMSVFAHADATDVALMALGLVGALGEGMSTPVRMIIFSHIANDLGNGPDNLREFTSKINENARKLVILALASSIMAFLEGYCWARTAERQASRMRARYLRAVLRQDMEHFDLSSSGSAVSDVVTSVSSDSLAVQDALAHKVPNFLANAATFFGSYAVAVALLPRLALAALPSLLLLVVPGLAYGRALAALARRVRDGYAAPGAVAEQAVASARTVYAFAAEASAVARFSATFGVNADFFSSQ